MHRFRFSQRHSSSICCFIWPKGAWFIARRERQAEGFQYHWVSFTTSCWLHCENSSLPLSLRLKTRVIQIHCLSSKRNLTKQTVQKVSRQTSVSEIISWNEEPSEHNHEQLLCCTHWPLTTPWPLTCLVHNPFFLSSVARADGQVAEQSPPRTASGLKVHQPATSGRPM